MVNLAWIGPIDAKQIVGSVPSGAALSVFTCTGDGSGGTIRCQDRADKWLDGTGRRLPRGRENMKIGPGPVWFAAFSAGGQIVKRFGLNALDRAEIAGMYLADATYTAKWARPREAAVDDVLKGFVLYALDVLHDGRPMLATASSSPNKKAPTGEDTLAAIEKDIETHSGQTFEDASSDPIFTGLRPPVRARRLGSILFVYYGDHYKHAEHATEIARVLLPRLIEGAGHSPLHVPDNAKWRYIPAALGTAALVVWIVKKVFLP